MRRWLGLLVLAAMAMPGPAAADVTWSGAGYYVVGDTGDCLDLCVPLYAGPFSTQAQCSAALAALPQDEQKGASCDYEAADPDKN